MTLRALDFSGVKSIAINADASRGSVRAELLNDDGYRVRGFTQDESQPLTADGLDQTLTWKDKTLADLPPGPYYLRLYLNGARNSMRSRCIDAAGGRVEPGLAQTGERADPPESSQPPGTRLDLRGHPARSRSLGAVARRPDARTPVLRSRGPATRGAKRAPVWGTAQPGEPITVRYGVAAARPSRMRRVTGGWSYHPCLPRSPATS